MTGDRWRRFNWLDDLVLPVLQSAMRAAWMTPVINLGLNNLFVYPWGVRYPYWLVMGLLLGGALAARLLAGRSSARLRTALAGLVVVLVCWAGLFWPWGNVTSAALRALWAEMTDLSQGVHAAVVAILLTAVVWGRAVTVEFDDYDGLWRDFNIGVAALIGCLLLSRTALPAPDLKEDLAPALSSFVLWGLLALALSGVSRAAWLDRFRHGRTLTLSRHWLAVVGMVILLLVAGGMIIGQLFVPEVVERLRRALGLILSGIGLVFAYLATAIAWVFFWLVGPLLDRFRAQNNGAEPRVAPAMPDIAEQFRDLQQEEAIRGPQGDPGVAVLVITLIVAAGLLVLLWRRRTRMPSYNGEEMRETIWSRDLLADQLRNLFHRRTRADARRYLPLDGLSAARRRIREAYQQVLEAAGQRGWPRPRGLTASGYRQTLAAHLPEAAQPLEVLTAAYGLARYADLDPDDAQADAAVQAADEVRAALAAAGER